MMKPTFSVYKHPVMTAWMRSLYCVLTVVVVAGIALPSDAREVVGVGTASLLGSDLTDIGNDGDKNLYSPPNLAGFDAEFFSSDEPGFNGGEFAFNVFDNMLGPGNAKWCCGTTFPQIVGASFPRPFFLTQFTVSSANDVPDRDPRVWTIDGSNDGANWTTIFTQDDPMAQVWTERFQVIRFDSGVDFPLQTTAYTQFRMSTTATALTTGAFFQVGEIEFFGEGEQVVLGDVNGDQLADNADFAIIRDNFLLTPAVRTDGDLNFDRIVDLKDFQEWRNAAFPAAAAVPEPAALSLVLAGLALLGAISRRRR